MHRLQENTHPGNLSSRRLVLWCSLALLFAILDVFLKSWALHHLGLNSVTNSGLVALTLHQNPGIIFDMPVPLSLVIALTMVILLVLLWQLPKYWRAHDPRLLAAWCVTLGALGNLVDRLVNGFTTDYLLLFQRSAFNISDILIGLGILLFFFYNRSNSRQA